MRNVRKKLSKWGICFFIAILLCTFAGCGAKKKDTLEKIKDLEFTVLADENIPEELKNVIEEKKGNTFKVTYQYYGECPVSDRKCHLCGHNASWA